MLEGNQRKTGTTKTGMGLTRGRSLGGNESKRVTNPEGVNMRALHGPRPSQHLAIYFGKSFVTVINTQTLPIRR